MSKYLYFVYRLLLLEPPPPPLERLPPPPPDENPPPDEERELPPEEKLLDERLLLDELRSAAALRYRVCNGCDCNNNCLVPQSEPAKNFRQNRKQNFLLQEKGCGK